MTTMLNTNPRASAEAARRDHRQTLRHRLAARTRANGLPIAVWIVVLRGIVLVADYALALVTAVGLIPTLGVWLHRESGAAQGSLTGAGTIAMWVLPLVFLVALLTAGELALMRSMWRWSGRRIQKIRDSRECLQRNQTEPVHSRSGATTKRSK